MQLWEHLFNCVAWPTLCACLVPIIGLSANAFARDASKRSDEGSAPAGTSPSKDNGNSSAQGPTGRAQTVWTIRVLLLVTAWFLAGILFLAVVVRLGSVAGWPPNQAIGIRWWIALAVGGAMVASSVCLHLGVRGAADPPNRVSRGWIAAAVLLAILCGTTVAWQLSLFARRGLGPPQAERMIHPRADLAYVSAVRLRVLNISSDLTTREANEGSLSPEDVALRDLCDRMNKKLIAPTERAVIETHDVELLAGLAEVVAARNDQPPDKTAFDGTEQELPTLMREIRQRATVLRLPIVAAGGRERMGVHCLLSIVFTAYWATLLAIAARTILMNRGPARSTALCELRTPWYLGAAFAAIWLCVG
jgi:hypothetical protein